MSASKTEEIKTDPGDAEQKRKKAQRARNIAIALGLIAFVVILYVATWAKLGANVMVREL